VIGDINLALCEAIEPINQQQQSFLSQSSWHWKAIEITTIEREHKLTIKYYKACGSAKNIPLGCDSQHLHNQT
jgi:hypothetical protein